MSIEKLGASPFLEGYFEGETPFCFYCGKPLEEEKDVILWSGCGGVITNQLPFIPKDPADLLIIDKLAKSGMCPEAVICFHPNCILHLCAGLLRDWKEVVNKQLDLEIKPKY